jgi:ribosomal protein S19
MSRSLWKGVFISRVFYTNYYLNKEISYNLSKGNTVFIKNFLTFIFYVYTGKVFIEFVADLNLLGFRLGQFIFTRKMGFVHKDSKNKKKLKRKKK